MIFGLFLIKVARTCERTERMWNLSINNRRIQNSTEWKWYWKCACLYLYKGLYGYICVYNLINNFGLRYSQII